MSKLTIVALKPSRNNKSVMVNFELREEREWSAASSLSDFQRANGMTAASGTDTVVRYASERVTPEVAANLTVGQEVSGFSIRTYKSETPFYIVDGKPQSATKSGLYFDGEVVSVGLGDSAPADVTASMDTHGDRYRVVVGDQTLRGAAATAKMRDLAAQARLAQTAANGAPATKEAANAPI